MTTANAYPPTLLQESRRISPSDAQQLVSEFLKATTTDPSLHPNALLTENGPVVASSGSTGLVLHNLKRVEAGLRGEHIAADLTFKDYGGQGLPTLMSDQVPNTGTETEKGKGEADQGIAQGWQDKAEYEREQTVEQGEVGLRSNVLERSILNGRPGNERREIPAVENAGGASTVDKAERKRKKKEKRDLGKRRAEALRQKDSKAEKQR
ncbi:MAG: hypothetical protein LQ349_002505 [Xanthoria aureola]|nr:MAG: hypothetical protein LQ349_002505 [Xanthoria aureola]